jgi:hypothetical protein
MQLQLELMGAQIGFESNSRALLRLVREAYVGLPSHRLSKASPSLTIRLVLRPGARPRPQVRTEPAVLDMFSGSGWLGAASQASDLVILSPRQRTALVVVSQRTLAFPYHTRYELIEFAVFTLVARCQRLASLHAACVGLSGRGALLMGPSGSGKSTLTMLCMLRGFEFLAEDSVFVAPGSLRATGIANFLHVRSESLKWLDPGTRRLIRRSPMIRRRSGVKKFEVDLRSGGHRLARTPLKIAAVVFLSAQRAPGQSLLIRLSRRALLSKLVAAQAYAVNQPGWAGFSKRIAMLPAYELQRGRHPDECVEALRLLLAPTGRRR